MHATISGPYSTSSLLVIKGIEYALLQTEMGEENHDNPQA